MKSSLLHAVYMVGLHTWDLEAAYNCSLPCDAEHDLSARLPSSQRRISARLSQPNDTCICYITSALSTMELLCSDLSILTLLCLILLEQAGVVERRRREDKKRTKTYISTLNVIPTGTTSTAVEAWRMGTAAPQSNGILQSSRWGTAQVEGKRERSLKKLTSELSSRRERRAAKTPPPPLPMCWPSDGKGMKGPNPKTNVNVETALCLEAVWQGKELG